MKCGTRNVCPNLECLREIKLHQNVYRCCYSFHICDKYQVGPYRPPFFHWILALPVAASGDWTWLLHWISPAGDSILWSNNVATILLRILVLSLMACSDGNYLCILYTYFCRNRATWQCKNAATEWHQIIGWQNIIALLFDHVFLYKSISFC